MARRAVRRGTHSAKLESAAQQTRRAFTLLELVLVLGIMVVITALAVPSFFGRLKREELPGSAQQMRSLITLVRAHAAFDGMRYRIRFPEDDEEDPLGGDQQPIIEREIDPIDDPGIFDPVTSPWAVGKTVLGEAWCAEIRLGKPTIEMLRRTRSQIRDAVDEELEDFSPERPPLIIEPDGTSDWATFVLTTAPRDTSFDDLEHHERVEIILDGETGLAWLQRSFYDEEVDLFEEKGWPVVLRRDWLDPRVLTEDDVLELWDIEGAPSGGRASSAGLTP